MNPCLWADVSKATEWDQCVESTLRDLSRFSGWCTTEKAKVLMDFIYETRPKVCVEIGAFGGSTTYPLVSALTFIGDGVLYAIDAWDSEVAIEGLYEDDPNRDWWNKLEMDSIYAQFMITMSRFAKSCKPIRKRSEQAVNQFLDESIDLLYLDGNFSSTGSLQDAILYFPKVKKEGYIWVNDAHIAAKNQTVTFLMDNSEWVKAKSIKNKCIVFQKKG